MVKQLNRVLPPVLLIKAMIVFLLFFECHQNKSSNLLNTFAYGELLYLTYAFQVLLKVFCCYYYDDYGCFMKTISEAADYEERSKKHGYTMKIVQPQSNQLESSFYLSHLLCKTA